MRVTRGTAKLLKSTDPIFYWSGFPKLFPFGIGTPCARPVMYQLLLARLTYRTTDRSLDEPKVSSFQYLTAYLSSQVSEP
jgi:hypothetical protein